MRVERLRPTTFQITLGAFELAALVAAARWVVGGAAGELTPEAFAQLRTVVASYDEQQRRLAEGFPDGAPQGDAGPERNGSATR